MIALLKKLIGSLEQQNEQKDELIRQKDAQIAQLEEQIVQLNQTVANLNETVLEFQRKLFGTSSEKTPSDTFNEAEAEQDPSAEDPPAGTVVGGYARARRTKKKKATYEELMSGSRSKSSNAMLPKKTAFVTGAAMKWSMPDGKRSGRRSRSFRRRSNGSWSCRKWLNAPPAGRTRRS